MKVTRPKNRRAGFTLVELLVVISIIAVLSALLTVGLYAAFNASKSFVLGNEVTQISSSIEQFKSKLGSYPPDMQSSSGFNAFVGKAYPRSDRPAVNAFVTAAGGRIDPAEALVLYLAYTSTDPRYPFRFATLMAGNSSAWQSPSSDLANFYSFPPGTLRDLDTDGFPEFVQVNAKGAPLVYFDARTYTQTSAITNGNPLISFQSTFYLTGPAVPCASVYDSSTNRYTFFNPTSYQLICAGQDGEFGIDLSGPRKYPVINPAAALALPRVSESDGDNIANFTSAKKFDIYLAQ